LSVMPRPVPNDRFRLCPLEGEDVVKKILGTEEGDEAESVSDEPEDEEEADS